MSANPKRVYLSYAWGDDDYLVWVKRLATRLRVDGVNARLDVWHVSKSGSIPEFMNREIRLADWVLVLCSPGYQAKVRETEDGDRVAGVGWETRLLSSSILAQNENKVIAALTRGAWKNAAPDALLGQVYYDLSDPATFEVKYRELLQAITGTEEQAPPLGQLPESLAAEPIEPLRGEPSTTQSPAAAAPPTPSSLNEDAVASPSSPSAAAAIRPPPGETTVRAGNTAVADDGSDRAPLAPAPAPAPPRDHAEPQPGQSGVIPPAGGGARAAKSGRLKRSAPIAAALLAAAAIGLGPKLFPPESPPTPGPLNPAVGKLLALGEIVGSRQLGRDILLYLNQHVQHNHRVRQLTYDNEALTIDILSPYPSTTYLAGIYSVTGFTPAEIANDPDQESDEAEFNGYTIRFEMKRARPDSSDAVDVPRSVLKDRMDRLLARLPAPSTLPELCARIKAVAAESPFRLDALEEQSATRGAPDDPYAVALVNVRATASLVELLSFLRHVGDLPYPIGLSGMKLKSVSETKSLIAVALRFSIPMAESGSSVVPPTSTRTAIPETRSVFRSSFRSEFARNLSIDEIRVTAITKEPDGYAAQVESSQGRYLLRAGDELENGSVATISLDQIAFNHATRGQYIVRVQ